MLWDIPYIIRNYSMTTFQYKSNHVNLSSCSWDISKQSLYSCWWPISRLFVVTFLYPTYIQIALIWDFIKQLSLWKLVHWLWKYKLNEVCNTYSKWLCVSRPSIVDFIHFYFLSFIWFFFFFIFYFLFLEQLRLGVISHAVTSVTNWWHSHKTDHGTWKNRVKGTRIKWRHTA